MNSSSKTQVSAQRHPGTPSLLTGFVSPRMRLIVILLLAVAVARLAGRASAESLVIPPGFEAKEGEASDCTFCQPVRQQAQYSSSLFPNYPITITEIWYRPDVSQSGAVAFSYPLADLEVRMSTTPKLSADPDLTFQKNIGPDEVLVYKGPWQYKSDSVGPTAGPKEFDIRLQLQTPFTYDPGKGNLLIDQIHFGPTGTRNHTDSTRNQVASVVWRALTGNPSAPMAAGWDGSAPIIRLVYTPVGGVPSQARGVAQTVNGFVVGVNVVNPGFGYTNPPAVRFLGGGGTGAAATARISDGMVIGVTVTNAGIGYTNRPIVKIAAPGGLPGLAIRTKTIAVDLTLILGRRYRLDSSRDLSSWSVVETFVAEDDAVTKEFDVSESGRYFRLTDEGPR